MWVGSVTPKYVNYIMRALEQIGNICYSYIKVGLGNLGGAVLPALCVGNIVHPKNIRRIHCSSQHYSLRFLLIRDIS